MTYEDDDMSGHFRQVPEVFERRIKALLDYEI